jgi:hypothetical protein
MANSCDRESSVVFSSMSIPDTNIGFDLDNADGDNNPYTGIDNVLGDGLLTATLNPVLETALADGSIALLVSFADINDPGDDPDVSLNMHGLVDPACPAAPVYDAGNPPPWIDAVPADVYSDSAAFPGCTPSSPLLESDAPATNGIYANSSPGQPPAPVIVMEGPQVAIPAGALGVLDFFTPRMEATIVEDGTFVTAIRNGLIGGVVPAEVLYAVDISADTGGLCPTALHAVLALVGGPDQDLDPSPGVQLDSFGLDIGGFGWAPCLFDSVAIVECVDAETGAVIGAVDGECVLDGRIEDGFSSSLNYTAEEVRVVEQRDSAAYCP